MSVQGPDQRARIRPAQVVAAALAALTAAFLGSRLGVYGTVLGAGVVSLLTTVGSELYLRSLERTRHAARRTKEVALARSARWSAVDARPEGPPAEAESPVEEDGPEEADERVETGPPVETGAGRSARWPVLAGATVVAFALGMVAVTGVEALIGGTLSGDQGGSTVGKVLGGGGVPDRPERTAPPLEQEKPGLATTPPATTTTPPSTSPPATSSEPSSSEGSTSGSPSDSAGEPVPTDGGPPSIGLTR